MQINRSFFSANAKENLIISTNCYQSKTNRCAPPPTNASKMGNVEPKIELSPESDVNKLANALIKVLLA